MVKLYADAGTTVNAQVFTSGVNGPDRLGTLTFHGYLVDMPLVLQVAPVDRIDDSKRKETTICILTNIYHQLRDGPICSLRYRAVFG